MSVYIKQICVLCIFFGTVVSLAPEGGAKKVMELTCTAAMALTLIVPLKGLDLETYALGLAKYREQEALLITNGGEASQRLNRLVIEGEYETYILDKAKELGMAVSSAEVATKWNTEGLWLPESTTIEGDYTVAQKKRLTGIIRAELGIAEEKQYWSNDGY